MRTLLGAALAAVTLLSASPVALAGAAPAQREADLSWSAVDVNTSQQFRGLSAVDASTAWVGGSQGGVWRTVDAGETWRKVGPDLDGKELLFRDVEALDADTALVMSIGAGRQSRIYRTDDGGESWDRVFTNRDQDAFYDCMSLFPDGQHGLAMSDPVDGKFRILLTEDGGLTWDLAPRKGMPRAVEGEFGFAASGTCTATAGTREAYFAGGGGDSRIFSSRDYGRTWRVTDAPIPAAEAGGVFSLAFKDPRTGLAVGGDFTAPEDGEDASAYGARGRWSSGGDLGGYRSGVDWLAGRRPVAIAVGPTGSDVTRDGGRTWTAFDDRAFDAVDCVADGACWAAGPDGAVALLRR